MERGRKERGGGGDFSRDFLLWRKKESSLFSQFLLGNCEMNLLPVA